MQFETVLKPELAERWRRDGYWGDETFFDILARRAEMHPEREVFVDAQERITFGALKDRVERCAAFLRRIGIERGDVVTIQLPNLAGKVTAVSGNIVTVQSPDGTTANIYTTTTKVGDTLGGQIMFDMSGFSKLRFSCDYYNPRASTAACSTPVITCGCTTASRLSSSISMMRLNRSIDSTTPPCSGTAPPVYPVPAPRGTSGTRCSLHSAAIAATSAVVAGIATTSAGRPRFSASVPYSSSEAKSSRT